MKARNGREIDRVITGRALFSRLFKEDVELMVV